MNSAYNSQFVYHLAVIKETKRWAKHNFITTDQFAKIGEEYKAPFYHPNLIIRMLLFVATLFALSGMSGILGLMFAQAGKTFIYFGCIGYGVGSFIALEKMFIANNHFKSGVTEAMMYHSFGFFLTRVAWLGCFNNPQFLIVSFFVIFFFSS